MSLVIPIRSIGEGDRARVGGKAFSLSVLARNSFPIPEGLSVTTNAYHQFVDSTDLRNRIMIELNRKSLDEMRWEEIWDSSLRIRNLFLRTRVPVYLSEVLIRELESAFGEKSVVVRSSAPGEDSAASSFAGLHESYVNVRGAESVIEHIKLVWASLWSDRALLYRKELGLDIARSAMAVLVQETVAGYSSGVVFGVSPVDPSLCVVEAVYGLNQGLVDGTVEPDRWMLERVSGTRVSFTQAERNMKLVADREGVRLTALPDEETSQPALTDVQVDALFQLSMQLEELFGAPQDSEWTFAGDRLIVLQSRPITTSASVRPEDERKWYLSLHRSFQNLQGLRSEIEDKLLPQMETEANELAKDDLTRLTDTDLIEAIGRRKAIWERWSDTYRTYFIPMAHGMRLFGQTYNDVMRPSDPYEFTKLLSSTGMLSVERNRLLAQTGRMLGDNPDLAHALSRGDAVSDERLARALDELAERFGKLSSVAAHYAEDRRLMTKLILEIAETEGVASHEPVDAQQLARAFISKFPPEKQEFAGQLLDMARASYRLRDDDNIYIGRIEAHMRAAATEAKKRLASLDSDPAQDARASELTEAMKSIEDVPTGTDSRHPDRDPGMKVRQLVGQPAGPGLAVGTARVIMDASDLFDFKNGDILVCDAVDPNMTFVVPLCKGIVERRGGMLIHGAIIAREYGLPCVTGVPDAATAIRSGDRVTVDGYLGIVIVG